jgi:hypothetical protein
MTEITIDIRVKLSPDAAGFACPLLRLAIRHRELRPDFAVWKVPSPISQPSWASRAPAASKPLRLPPQSLSPSAGPRRQHRLNGLDGQAACSISLRRQVGHAIDFFR